MSSPSLPLLSYFGMYCQPGVQEHNSQLTGLRIRLTVCRTMAPRATAPSVFSEFESNGWPTTGLACLVGLNGPLPYLAGADASVHLAEELKNSAWRLPRSMLVTAISNYITSFVIVGTLSIALHRNGPRR